MTDEEKAENYAKGLCKTCTFDTCRHNTLQTCAIKESLKQAHLDGLKANKPKWHDLRKNPEDLPKECENVLCVCNDFGYKYLCTGHLIYNTWISNIASKKIRVIAWCEISKYTDKE